MWNCIKRPRLAIKFDRDNKNAIHIHHGDKLVHMIAIPPSENRVDLFLDDSLYDFDGIVVTQSESKKTIIRKGLILDEIEL